MKKTVGCFPAANGLLWNPGKFPSAALGFGCSSESAALGASRSLYWGWGGGGVSGGTERLTLADVIRFFCKPALRQRRDFEQVSSGAQATCE